ncbi:P-loop containing nucleoside triphosphate hydrolases superfamily protein [Wolffia australiana]
MSSQRHDKEKAVNVQVLLRCRPFSDDEIRNNAPQVVTCNEFQREVAVSQTIAGKQIDRVFTFDKVFGPSAQQRDLYDQAVIPIVNEVLEGFNCTIFAYGQTGTGKTYTMEGDCKKTKAGPNGKLPPGAGVIPRAVKQIFDTLESQQAEYSVKVTFLELYNEEITDLLAPEELSKLALDDKQKKPLPLMEDGKGGVLVRGLEEEIVTNASEIFSLLERGSAKRRTAETLLNKQSSRSHSLFSITIHIKEATPEGEELIKCGKLNLVDLAGSENISRSGAREGRAREAGEINKSLLTLGRVITALVEHLGHVPYRDSKLTRLLRDSLGGKTKTCIIATVSPSVHCLEETLSTLDYAHRAKNIKNRPEVNQKMMKSTLIKDLYGEIDRLKAEVYAAREKVGVYIPKERYQQEEAERKAMAEQIEQMNATIETYQKQISDLQEKYDSEIHQCTELTKKLAATEKNLDNTSKMLAATKDDLKHCQYILKEKEFIISEQRKSEAALTNQACVLRSDLEKSMQDNASLYLKMGKEDQLNSENRLIVNSFQLDLEEKVRALGDILSSYITRQKEQLDTVEEICKSCVESQEKSSAELAEKVAASRAVYISHIETIHNIVQLHKANSDGSLDQISSSISAHHSSLEELLASGEKKSDQLFGKIQEMLLSHRAEIARFAQELRERFQGSLQQSKDTSDFILGVFSSLGDESQKFYNDMNLMQGAQGKHITDFQKAFEEQSKAETEKLLAEVSSLVSGHMSRQMELVSGRLCGLEVAAVENKAALDAHNSSIRRITNDAKRKWEELCAAADGDFREGADFSAAKHCRMEVMLQNCVDAIGAASNHWKETSVSVNATGTQHVTALEEIIRASVENNGQHALEIASTRRSAEEDAAKGSEDILAHFQATFECWRGKTSRIASSVKVNEGLLERLQEEHSAGESEIRRGSEKTFREKYQDYKPTGETPEKWEPNLPSRATIESLRARPINDLLEEFRENNPPEPINAKEPKPTSIPRCPLSQLNSLI